MNVGQIFPTLCSTPPNAHWLLCDGSTFNSTTYPLLYYHLGSNVLPDLREMTIAGAGTNNSTELCMLSFDGHESGTVNTYGVSQMQAHKHSATSGWTRPRGGCQGCNTSSWTLTTKNVDAQGTDTFVDPNIGVNYMIYAG